MKTTTEIQITSTDFKDRLVVMCDRITDFFGWDMEKEQKEWDETGRRSITPTEDLRKTVYKAKLESNINHGLGITALYERIETPDRWGAGFADLLGYNKHEDFTPERIEEHKNV